MYKLLITLFLILGCNYQDPLANLKNDELSDEQKIVKIKLMFDGYKKEFPGVINLNPEEVLSLSAPVYVDVRERREYETSMIQNAITLKEYKQGKDQYQGRPVIVYCTIGYRSGLQTVKLRKNGVEAYNLLGGVLLWSHANKDFFLGDERKSVVHVYGEQWALLRSDLEAIY